MPLNKDVCKSCQYRKENGLLRWLSVDDLRWAHGWVSCSVSQRIHENAFVKYGVPEHCPYALEHIVEQHS